MAMTATFARLRSAAWLGWQVESNWADPVLFTIYIVARPLATAAILVAMYHAVRGSGAHDPIFVGFFVANAFHNYVNTVMVGMGWVVFEEREEYETLKYVYAAPIGIFTYLVGRSGVKFALASLSMVITLTLGWVALGVRWDWAQVQWWPLAGTIALGLAAALFMGLLLAGWALVLTRAAMLVLEGVTVSLYLLCGVIFPIDLLPRVLQWVSLGLPFTWWYEALRRFLLGKGSSAMLATIGDLPLLAVLAAVTLVFSVASFKAYSALERQARRLGRLDQTTLY
ncbi:MAG: ABC transporter permease [Candidatus Eisenbacteria bacterium]